MVLQPPPSCDSSPPGCPSPPLLLVWMNVSSLPPWLLSLHTVQFSGHSGCFLFLNWLSPFFGCARRWCISTYASILDWTDKAFIFSYFSSVGFEATHCILILHLVLNSSLLYLIIIYSKKSKVVPFSYLYISRTLSYFTWSLNKSSIFCHLESCCLVETKNNPCM